MQYDDDVNYDANGNLLPPLEAKKESSTLSRAFTRTNLPIFGLSIGMIVVSVIGLATAGDVVNGTGKDAPTDEKKKSISAMRIFYGIVIGIASLAIINRLAKASKEPEQQQ